MDGETLGPLLCERHNYKCALKSGVIGFPNLAAETSSYVHRISNEICGKRIAAARAFGERPNLVLLLDDGAVLVFFTVHHQTVFSQYIPASRVTYTALEQLSLVQEGCQTSPILVAVNAKLVIESLEIGNEGHTAKSIHKLALRFRGGSLLDFESVGWSYFNPELAGDLVLSWRKGFPSGNDSHRER